MSYWICCCFLYRVECISLILALLYISLSASLSLSLSAFQLNAIVFIGMTVQYNITQALKQ